MHILEYILRCARARTTTHNVCTSCALLPLYVALRPRTHHHHHHTTTTTATTTTTTHHKFAPHVCTTLHASAALAVCCAAPTLYVCADSAPSTTDNMLLPRAWLSTCLSTQESQLRLHHHHHTSTTTTTTTHDDNRLPQQSNYNKNQVPLLLLAPLVLMLASTRLAPLTVPSLLQLPDYIFHQF